MVIEFSKFELLYIDDQLTVDRFHESKYPMRSLGGGAVLSAHEDFLKRIGWAIVHVITHNLNSIELDLSEDELWIVRELAQSGIRVGQEAVGLNLKMKIYKAILESDWSKNYGDIKVNEEDERTKDEVQDLLDMFKDLEGRK